VLRGRRRQGHTHRQWAQLLHHRARIITPATCNPELQLKISYVRAVDNMSSYIRAAICEQLYTSSYNEQLVQ
jgi:hypothetical protein